MVFLVPSSPHLHRLTIRNKDLLSLIPILKFPRKECGGSGSEGDNIPTHDAMGAVIDHPPPHDVGSDHEEIYLK